MAALRHYRKPQVDLPELGMPLLVSSDVREPTPLPLHHTPLSISFALIHADDVALSTSSTLTVASLVDSTEREELVQTGSISLAMNIHSEVCLLDFGGGCELQPSQLKKCWKLAETSIHQLCQMLESTLQEADEKAQQERLHRLQQLQDYPNLPPLPADPAPPVPFWFQDGDLQVDVSSPFADPSQEVQEAEGKVKDQEQEAYRLQALDFTRGHIAARVREDDKKKIPQEGTNTLLVAMLQAVQTNDVGSGEEGGLDANIVSRHEISSRSDAEHSSSPASRFQSAAKSPAIALPEPKQGEGAIPVHFDDEDEEELPTILQSEFDAIKPSSKPAKAAVLTDDDVDDLAMAIKNKKKKPKKSK
jgi:exosome complex component RRP45